VDYRALVKTYLSNEDRGIWEERSPRIRKMYGAIARLSPSKKAILLLVTEIGNISEVARRLKLPKTTVWRVYDGIRKEIQLWCGD